MSTFIANASHGSRGTRVISLGGYLDAHTASDLEQMIERTIGDGCVRIIVDFSDLEYISSAGLGVFMVFIEQVRSASGDIKLAAMKPKVFTVFDLLGFPVLFEIYPTVEDAVGRFPEPSEA
ncbi:MAG: STAS domain-containing protein [Candidatus Kapabacteria bacterium]|jgi:anti-sigma B factor antagonist|nr:STAS domain-containing protein [Candidatus Kapabacteria bacterium]